MLKNEKYMIIVTVAILVLVAWVAFGDFFDSEKLQTEESKDSNAISDSVKVQSDERKYSQDDFWELLIIEKSKGDATDTLTPTGMLGSSDKKEDYFDITPLELNNEIGCQIFKNSQWCDSYLVYSGSVYPLGMCGGGLGVVDIKTCDFDENGKKDILFTYSMGVRYPSCTYRIIRYVHDDICGCL